MYLSMDSAFSVSKSDDIKEDADVKPDDMEDKEDKEEKEERKVSRMTKNFGGQCRVKVILMLRVILNMCPSQEEGSPYPEDTVKQDSAVGGRSFRRFY